MLNNNSCIFKVNDAKQDEDDLYSFMRPAAQPSAHCPISKELDDFLQSKASSVGLQSLLDYPLIASAFVKANSTLPSSAAVERLMHKWDDIVSIRCKTTDKLFDNMVFLKCLSPSYIFVNTAVTL